MTAFSGCYCWLVATYLSLPDPVRYGNLLQITPFLVRHPTAVTRYAWASTILSTLFAVTFAVALPQAKPDLRLEADISLQFFIMVGFLWLIVGFQCLGWNLKKLFRKTIKACETAVVRESSVASNISKQELTLLKVTYIMRSELLLT